MFRIKILFINPSLRPEAQKKFLPVGLAYIMTAVKKSGFSFDLVDMDIGHISIEALQETLAKNVYDVYALGCIVTGFRFIKVISSIIRKINPRAVIIAGNSVASSISDILLQNTEVDVAVMGEGDISIVELLRSIERGSQLSEVSGIAFKKEQKIIKTKPRPVIDDIDTIGFPDWDIFELGKYKKYNHLAADIPSAAEAVSFPINSARGCPFDCTFCYHVFKKQPYRRYSEGAIMEEVERLHYKYGCSYISFWDELTFLNIKRVEFFVKGLKSLNFKVEWQAEAWAGLFKKEHLGLIKEMKDCGCRGIGFSLENGNTEILKAMNKKITVEQFVEQANILREGGVSPHISLIFGYPQETQETIRQTLDICERCAIYPSVGYLLPLPATPIYEWARENGYIINELDYLNKIGDRQDMHVNLTKMDDTEFMETVETGLRSLAERQGLRLGSVLKTGSYQVPKARAIP